MCDTFVALPSFTASGNLIFAKNSDREPNESQSIVRLPGRSTDRTSIQCTYIEIPEVGQTHEVILSKPFQMWGAEMGANEHGLVVGNEAVFTKIKSRRTNNGLTGMDLVRLVLERCKNAREAVRTITELLETYGQDACGGYRNQRFFYDNSFLIADAHSAWVLETADRHWVAQQVDGYRSISNGLTIETDYDLISDHAIDFAIRKGWAKVDQPFNFRQAYSDWLFTRASHCVDRQHTTTKLGESKAGRLDPYYAIEILSSHERECSEFNPTKATSASICMHATGPINPSQTNGSMIAEIRANQPSTIWLTGTSMPCLSVFVPYFFGESDSIQHPLAPLAWNSPGESPDDSLWWQAERLHREICRGYQHSAQPFHTFRDELQYQLLMAEKKMCCDLAARHRMSKKACEQVRTFIRDAADRTPAHSDARVGWMFRYFWNRMNREAGLF